jgi:predicted metal-dependent HD superfamily phosphohydrolase
MNTTLASRWYRLTAPLLPDEDRRAAMLKQLTDAYQASDRHYHSLQHVRALLDSAERYADIIQDIEVVQLAIWFHDAVYNPKAGGNEQKSAEWASRVIVQVGLSEEIAERVAALILATRHREEIESDEDAQVLVDVDLSILGREADVYWGYERNIRKEYAWVPEAIFKQKRAEILRSFLKRERIYQVELYRSKYEERARENLRQAITKLESSSVAT